MPTQANRDACSADKRLKKFQRESLKKLQPYHGSVTIEKAHDVRRLRVCVCQGIGMADMMIQRADGKYMHGRCYIKRFGIRAFFDLPRKQTDRLPLSDIGMGVMRQLVARAR